MSRLPNHVGGRAATAPRRLAVAGALLAVMGTAAPEGASAQSAAADRYVRLGLDAAFSQRQQAIQLDLAGARRREVLGNALPKVELSSTRTEVGGNVVDIGRFINPAYAALNQLLGQPAFPTDVSFRLPFRQQSFVRLTQPVFAPQAWFGAQAASRAEDAQRLARDGASRDVERDIRLAWLQWQRARQGVAVYDAAVPLAEEALRVSERLVQAGVRTPDAVLSARADLSAVRQERAQVAQQVDAAARWLNHLVARPLQAPVEGDSLASPMAPAPLDELLRDAVRGREELRQLDAAARASESQRRSAQSTFLPTLAVAFDYGIQGQDYGWRGDKEFRIATIVAQWNVLNGAADRARVQQATLQRRALDAQHDEVSSLVAMQVRTAHDAVVVALQAIASATDRRVASERAYALLRRRYDEGLATPIELLEARREATAAALNLVITTTDYHARRIELDRAAAPAPRSQP